jgi:hypothetical protein
MVPTNAARDIEGSPQRIAAATKTDPHNGTRIADWQ